MWVLFSKRLWAVFMKKNYFSKRFAELMYNGVVGYSSSDEHTGGINGSVTYDGHLAISSCLVVIKYLCGSQIRSKYVDLVSSTLVEFLEGDVELERAREVVCNALEASSKLSFELIESRSCSRVLPCYPSRILHLDFQYPWELFIAEYSCARPVSVQFKFRASKVEVRKVLAIANGSF